MISNLTQKFGYLGRLTVATLLSFFLAFGAVSIKALDASAHRQARDQTVASCGDTQESTDGVCAWNGCPNCAEGVAILSPIAAPAPPAAVSWRVEIPSRLRSTTYKPATPPPRLIG